MTYTFHNRFTTFNERVNIDAGIYVLADTDRERVVLLAGSRETMIKDTVELVLQGSRYPDEATAVAAAQQWRRDLTVAFARTHIGTAFGPDDSAPPPAIDIIDDNPAEELRQIGIQPGDRIIRDEHRLLVVTSEPQPRFLRTQLRGTVHRGIEQFESNLNDARARSGPEWSPEKTLAHRLVTYALRDTNPETQHIQLVTAIEVLLQQQDRPKAVLEALNGLIVDIEERPADKSGTQKRLLEILRGQRVESISRAACNQLPELFSGTYHDKTVDAFFRQVYDMRSRLLHRKRHKNETRPTTVELGEVHFELLRLVLDYLDVSD